MYIYIPSNQSNQMQENQGQCNLYAGFMDAINIASFMIGLQNLDLNITANDIDKQTETILNDLHSYLDKQEKHLLMQDNHLLEQDKRLDRLEKMIYGKDDWQERRTQ